MNIYSKNMLFSTIPDVDLIIKLSEWNYGRNRRFNTLNWYSRAECYSSETIYSSPTLKAKTNCKN